MKARTLFSLCCLLVGTVHSMPAQEDTSSEEHQADTDTMIVGCLVENWKEDQTEENNMVSVGTCLKCLEEAKDPLSTDGLPKIKNCISTFMPTINQECARVIASVEVGNVESGMDALKCFGETLDHMGREWCLSKSSATEVVDKMTDAVGCVLDSYKNVSDFVSLVKQKEGLENSGEEDKTKDDQFMYLTTMAHCDVAADGDSTRSGACKACFSQMFSTETSSGDNGHMQLTEAARCSATYLMPYYQDCQPGMDNLLHTDPTYSKEKGMEVYKCYVGKLIKYVMSGCVEEAAEATMETLNTAMQCGKTAVTHWLMHSAGPQVATNLEEILSEVNI